MDRMEALWLENNRLTMRRIPVPDPAQGEALVRVRLAGICATDLELVRGYYPYSGVLGHEFVGEIADSPDAPERLGQRVVGEINTRCGKCDACRADRSNHCEKRTVLGIRNRNGSFAEYLLLPLENLHPVPESVPDEWAVFTEPLAAALQITRQVAIRPQDRVVLVGAGRLGQLIAQVLAATGCDLKVLARYQGQRDQLARSGIKWIESGQLEANRADIVVEVTGSRQGFETARQAVRPGGTIVLKSTFEGQMEIDMSALVVDEITVIGSRCGPFDAALQMLADGKINLDGMVMGRYPLSDALAAIGRAAERGVLKVLLEMPQNSGEG